MPTKNKAGNSKPYEFIPMRVLKNVWEPNAKELGEVARKDLSIYIAFRKEGIFVYYRGSRIGKMNSKRPKIDENFYKPAQKLDPSFKPEPFSSVSNWVMRLSETKNYVDTHHAEIKKAKEREYQQNIIQQVNSNVNSEYYIIDMEYTPQLVKCGTFDMIAFSKNKQNNEKYKLAVIELKQGDGALEDKSGIVDHLTKIQKYMGNDCRCPEAREILRKEVFDMVNNYRKLGLPQARYFPIIKSCDEIDVDDIQPLVVCVNLPYGDSVVDRILKKAKNKQVTRDIVKVTRYLTFSDYRDFNEIKMSEFRGV